MISYFPFISILILLIFAGLTQVVYRYRRSLTASWLVATSGALIAWILTLLTGMRLPIQIPLMRWSPVELFPDSPAWLVDQVSWPVAFALSTLALAVILTDVAREFEVEASSWAACLALAALGIASAYSGNPMTFLMGWAALDFAELIFLFQRLPGDVERRQAVVVFSTKVGGIFLLIYGQIVAIAQGSDIEFGNIPQSSILYLLLAVSLRLGIIPLHVPFWQVPLVRRGIGTMVRLVSPAASLVFLARIHVDRTQSGPLNLLFLLTVLAAIFAGFSWYNASNELSGRQYFILGMGALAFGTALQGHPEGSLAWGAALVFSGGFLFLYSSRHRILRLFVIVVVASSAALPFAPTWQGGQLYAAPISIWHLLFLLAHIQILAGFIRHSWGIKEDLSKAERWVRVFYPAGLLFLVISSFLAAWWGGHLAPGPSWGISLESLLPAILVLAASFSRVYWDPILPHLPLSVRLNFRNVFSLDWFYAILGWSFRLIGRAISFITMILEGEGGVLWALLLLTLLIALLTGRGVMGS